MRITIDIDDATLAEVQKATGVRKKSPAVRQALDSYVAAVERSRFLRKVREGKCDYSLTNEQIEASGEYDAD